MSVVWRGVHLDERSAAMMDEVVRLCPNYPIQPTQGSWSGASTSAGTHTGAGAIDLSAAGLTSADGEQIVIAMRRVGWCAWWRTPAEGDWPHHIHGVAMACQGLSAAALGQCSDYLAGLNGLANNGPDTGPRDFHYPGITWEEYLAGGDQDMTPEQAAALDNIAWTVAQIKPQTDNISPRILGAVEQTNWGVNDDDAGIRATLVDVVARLERIEAKVEGS